MEHYLEQSHGKNWKITIDKYFLLMTNAKTLHTSSSAYLKHL